jgi:outer membrane receptor protein involved in Fe transport
MGGVRGQAQAATAVLWALASATAGAADAPPAQPEKSLATVVVNADKLSVETRIDRKIYTVTEDAQSTFGTLSDILSVLPSVDIDPDGVLTLRGDSNVLILIDGKPSTLFQGSAAADNLQSISAKDIERIEVLTTPPAQFKAEGAAGVINIILRKHRARGTSGTAQGSIGDGGRSAVGATLTYGGERFTGGLSAGYREDYRQRLIQTQETGPDPVSGQVLESQDVVSERIRRNLPNAGLTGEYVLNDRATLAGSASWSKRGGLRTYTQVDDSVTPAGMTTSSTERLSSGHDPENSYDTALRFTQKLGRSGEELDLSLHRAVSHQYEHYDYTNDPFIPPAPAFYNNLSFHEEHGISQADLDYTLPLSKQRSMSLGYAFEQDDYAFSNVGENVDPATGALVIDPLQTNQFSFQQRIEALYASYQETAGRWTWLLGLRGEVTTTDAVQITNQVSTPGRYAQLYPSLHVDRNLSEQSTVSFGASRRVTRPDPSNLNPYLDYEYKPNLRTGNPNLRPQYTQSFEVGYGYEWHGASYGLTGYYRHNVNSVTNLTEYLGNGVSLDTKTNLPRNDSSGIEFTATGHVLANLAYSVSGNAFYTQIDASQLGIPGLESTTGVNLKVKLDYRPTAADSAQISFTRTDKRLTPQGNNSAVDLVNLGYKRTLTPALSLVATVTDLFNGQHYRRIAITPLFTQVYERSVEGRVVFIGIVYSFGSNQKAKKPDFEYAPED